MELHQVLQFWSIFSLFYLSCTLSSPNPSRKGFQFQLPYMTSNIEEIVSKSFDYIIVGGGATGCPLAATLSEKFSVLVIERGGSPYGNPMVQEKKYFGYPLVDTETNEFSSISQKFVSLDGVTNQRGRILGGSTAINAGFYSRANPEFIKNVGLDEKLLKEAYEWVESKVVFKPILSPWQTVVMNGLLEEKVLPFNGYTLEHIEGTKISGTTFDNYGIRHTAADFLGVGNPRNITVLLNATASKIIFQNNGDRPRAYGVKLIKSNGNPKVTYNVYLKAPKATKSSSNGDVILSAGALGSPQLLMLSGIGPISHLSKFNIPIVSNLRGVGKTMKDEPTIRFLVDPKPKRRTPDPPQVTGITDLHQIVLQSSIRPSTVKVTRFSIAAKYQFPKSKGKLELNNTDPRLNPLVRFNYLIKKTDMDICFKMWKLVDQVSRSESVTRYLGAERKETVMSSEDEIRKYCKANVTTIYHYSGGCVVGSVVDKDYRVYGVKGLRVIDGSTLHESPGTNPMATMMMLGRYQGVKILGQRMGSYS